MACRNGSCSRNTPVPNRATPVPVANQQRQPIVQQQPIIQQQPIAQQQPSQPPKPKSWWERARETLFGRNAENKEVPIGYTPQQVQALNYLAQLGQAGLGQNAEYIQSLRKLMAQNQENFGIQPIEERARKDFANETIPTIANRFLAGNTRNSSGFQNAIGSSAADLETSLAALRNQFGQQQHSNLLQEQGQAFNREGNFMNMLQMGLRPQSEILHVPGDWGLAGEVIPAATKLGAAYLEGGGTASAVMQALKALFSANKDDKEAGAGGTPNQGSSHAIFQGSRGVSPQAPNLFGLSGVPQNQLQPQQLQAIQQQQNQYGQIFSPQSQLDYVKNVVQRLGTQDAQFADRNKVANNVLMNRQNQYQSLVGRGY